MTTARDQATMSKIGKPPQPEQGEDVPASELQLYASRVRVYPRSVQGIARNIKWAILILCLVVYYVCLLYTSDAADE